MILVFLTGDVFATEELVTFFVHNATRWKIDKIYILDNIPRAQKPPTLGDNRWGTDLTGASMISPGWGTTGFQLRVKTGMYVMVVFEKAGLGGPANNRTRWFYFEDNSQSYKWTVKDDPAQDTVVGTPNSSGSGPTPQQRRDLSQVR
ncbi:MAG: hypothetical protein EHM28_03215 [Spirochaetaceae bacterium]|nr:MAG: hypothetical protein EHM28_03215 [Spirochaetaceae bacterium]